MGYNDSGEVIDIGAGVPDTVTGDDDAPDAAPVTDFVTPGDNSSEDAPVFVPPGAAPPDVQIQLSYMLKFVSEEEVTMPDGMLAAIPMFVVVDAQGQPFAKVVGNERKACIIAGLPIPLGRRNLRHIIGAAGLPLDDRKIRNGPGRG